MSNRSKKHTLSVKIQQGNKVTERVLGKKEKLTIGYSPDNDVVLFGDEYPRKYTLMECQSDTCTINLLQSISGEIRRGESRIALKDLLVHELIPKRGDSFNLTISHGVSGVLNIGNASIAFLFDGMESRFRSLPAYSWYRATLKNLSKDLFYKSLLTFLVLFEALFVIKIQNIDLLPLQPPEVEKIPQRVARFIARKPQPEPEIEKSSALDQGTATSEGEQNGRSEDEATRPRNEESGGERDYRAPGGQGLLGVLGGLGESSKTGSAVDFLIDQGVVKEFDQLLGKATLKKNPGIGRGRGSGIGNGTGGGNDISALQAFGLSGGVDDLIGDAKGVESVGLQKQGQVQVEKPGQMRGSQQAMGQRSAESVMAVINAQQGRIMYTYNKYLRLNPKLRGKVSIDLTIEANGRVSSVTVVETSISNIDLIRDLQNIFRRLKFEPIAEGSVTVNVPLIFSRVS